MKIDEGQHLMVMGVTGSGKTYWVQHELLPSYPRVLVVDTEDYDFANMPRVSTKRAVQLATGDRPFGARVVVNPFADLSQLWEGLVKRGHDLLIYIDEVTDFGRPGRLEEGIITLARKARKRRITLVAATQRPQLLDKTLLANAHHRVYFYLSDYDTAAVRDYCPVLQERMAEIPYGSYRYLYQTPDGVITLEDPV